MNLNELLKTTFEKRASDLHLKVGVPPVLRIDGRLVPLDTEKGQRRKTCSLLQ